MCINGECYVLHNKNVLLCRDSDCDQSQFCKFNDCSMQNILSKFLSKYFTLKNLTYILALFLMVAFFYAVVKRKRKLLM